MHRTQGFGGDPGLLRQGNPLVLLCNEEEFQKHLGPLRDLQPFGALLRGGIDPFYAKFEHDGVELNDDNTVFNVVVLGVDAFQSGERQHRPRNAPGRATPVAWRQPRRASRPT